MGELGVYGNLSLCLLLCLCVLICLPFRLIVPPFLPHFLLICIPVCPCISFCSITFPSVYLYAPAYLSVQLRSHLYTCMPLHIFLFNYVPICIPVCPCISFCPITSPSVYLFTCSSIPAQLHPTEAERKIRLQRANEQFYFEMRWIIEKEIETD